MSVIPVILDFPAHCAATVEACLVFDFMGSKTKKPGSSFKNTFRIPRSLPGLIKMKTESRPKNGKKKRRYP
jgi:hypothetical protein